MKRSARPLQSGSSTKDGVSVKPQHVISFTKVFAVYCGPPSWRRATPSATVGAIHPKAVVIPWRIGSKAAHRSPALATCQPMTSVVS
jgi:hypothetical protein